MTIEKHENATGTHLYRKGKYASSTENRRLVWEHVVWPLILNLNKNYFTSEEYHKMRNKVTKEKKIPISKYGRRHVSLLVKGISLRMGSYIRFITN